MPLGFLVIYRRQPAHQGAVQGNASLVDEIRKPRGRTVLEEKT